VGLVHEIDLCMQSGKWTFVICNCERDICITNRVYFQTGKLLWSGPEVATHDRSLCVGIDKCGHCLERCIFDANIIVDGKSELNLDKCMGCGLCVETCLGKARSMVRRKDYKHHDQIPVDILLGQDQTAHPPSE
jgi:Na+-translocating ferredoxin:NAD+ oxidoreductase RNF subunit RnfB